MLNYYLYKLCHFSSYHQILPDSFPSSLSNFSADPAISILLCFRFNSATILFELFVNFD